MAFKVGTQILPGYEMPVGDKLLVVFDRTGPASYTSFNTSTGVGGDVLTATGPLGRGGFDYIDSDGSDTTGQIQVTPVYPKAGSGNAVPSAVIRYFSMVTATLGGQAQTAGTEIVTGTNLSTFSFRIMAWMV